MTDANIEKVQQLVCSDRRLTISICVIANKKWMDKETGVIQNKPSAFSGETL